jgi:hypothetical protein
MWGSFVVCFWPSCWPSCFTVTGVETCDTCHLSGIFRQARQVKPHMIRLGSSLEGLQEFDSVSGLSRPPQWPVYCTVSWCTILYYTILLYIILHYYTSSFSKCTHNMYMSCHVDSSKKPRLIRPWMQTHGWPRLSEPEAGTGSIACLHRGLEFLEEFRWAEWNEYGPYINEIKWSQHRWIMMNHDESKFVAVRGCLISTCVPSHRLVIFSRLRWRNASILNPSTVRAS